MNFQCTCGWTARVIERRIRGIYQETDVYCSQCDQTVRYTVRCEVLRGEVYTTIKEKKMNLAHIILGTIVVAGAVIAVCGIAIVALLALAL